MELLFSYGTLQQDGVQQAQFGRKLEGRADALPGWRTDDSVAGMVFEITAEELAAADAYEVADYKRIAAPLASGVTAWVYVKA
jgi:gamma-glutamylcyclotransferase (GGCT)/AIG2-like uncharacterized protein YtfP